MNSKSRSATRILALWLIVTSITICLADVDVEDPNGMIVISKKRHDHDAQEDLFLPRYLQSVDSRIVDGSKADKSRFPYYAALTRDKGGDLACGGTLVASDVVLTAAHCWGANLKFAIVGNDEVIAIEKQYPHPNFNYNTRRFDQMLLKLERPSTKQTVMVNFQSNTPSSGEKLEVIGMGNTQFQGSLSNKLQQASMTYVENSECSKARVGSVDYKDEIQDDMICVQDDKQATCNGDSGGPFLILGKSAEEDIQVGIVSWGVACDADRVPGVGSRTSASNFIENVACFIASDPPTNLCGNSGRDVISQAPTMSPSQFPSNFPSKFPSAHPSNAPPSAGPSSAPSESGLPSTDPTTEPSPVPSESTSPSRSAAPSTDPSAEPSTTPTESSKPSVYTSPNPSAVPSESSTVPSTDPSAGASTTPVIIPLNSTSMASTHPSDAPSSTTPGGRRKLAYCQALDQPCRKPSNCCSQHCVVDVCQEVARLRAGVQYQRTLGRSGIRGADADTTGNSS